MSDTSAPKGIRTPVAGLKGQCPSPLDDGGVPSRAGFYHCKKGCQDAHPLGVPKRLELRIIGPREAQDSGLQRGGSNLAATGRVVWKEGELMERSLPISVLGRALRDFWDEMFTLMLCNVLWLIAHLLVITGPPATAALFYVTNRVAHGQVAKLSEFWYGLKQYFVVGWKWGGLNILAIIILANSVYFYSQGVVPGLAGFTLLLLSVLLLVGWLVTQLFAFPFWLEQSDKRIWVALRNAVILQAHNAVLTLAVLLLVAVVTVASYHLPPLVALGAVALLMSAGNAVVVAQVKALYDEDGQVSDG
jgi:uncharacterized membrane protein YesL